MSPLNLDQVLMFLKADQTIINYDIISIYHEIHNFLRLLHLHDFNVKWKHDLDIVIYKLKVKEMYWEYYILDQHKLLKNRYDLSSFDAFSDLNILTKSYNWSWMSPTIITGLHLNAKMLVFVIKK